MTEGANWAVALQDYCKEEDFESEIDSLLMNEVVGWIADVEDSDPPQCRIEKRGVKDTVGDVPKKFLSRPFKVSERGNVNPVFVTTLSAFKYVIVPRNLSQIGRVVRALYSLDQEEKQGGFLSFEKGDVIVVTKTSISEGWWLGELVHTTSSIYKVGGQGVFPANYVQPIMLELGAEDKEDDISQLLKVLPIF